MQGPVKWPLLGMCLSSYSGLHLDCAIGEVLRLWVWFSSHSPWPQQLLLGTLKSIINRLTQSSEKENERLNEKTVVISYSSVSGILPSSAHTRMSLMWESSMPEQGCRREEWPTLPCLHFPFWPGHINCGGHHSQSDFQAMSWASQ